MKVDEELPVETSKHLESLMEGYAKIRRADRSAGGYKSLSSTESARTYGEFVRALEEVYGKDPAGRTEEQRKLYNSWTKAADKAALGGGTSKKRIDRDELGKYTKNGDRGNGHSRFD